MSQSHTVAVVVGSLREGSVSRKVAQAVAALTPGLAFRIVEIGDLPHFDQDLEADPPSAWVRFRQEIAAADAVLFVTPEYNRSLPGVIKNAVDVGSRPYGESVWNGKPGGVISVSPGAIGGFGANHHLRQSLAFLNIPLLPAEAYIGNAYSLFDDAGELVNEHTTEFLRSYGEQFARWVHRFADATKQPLAA